MNRNLLWIVLGLGALAAWGSKKVVEAKYGVEAAAKWITPAKGQPYESAFKAASAKYTIPAGVLSRMAYQESNYDPRAKNASSGAQGMMQFMPDTAKWIGLSDPYNAQASIDAAGKYLRWLYDYIKSKTGVESWLLAIAAYNWGIGNVVKNMTGGKLDSGALPSETSKYMANVGKDTGLSGIDEILI